MVATPTTAHRGGVPPVDGGRHPSQRASNLTHNTDGNAFDSGVRKAGFMPDGVT